MPIQGVIFDLDGTLVDTLPDLTASVNAGLAQTGRPPRAASEIRRWVGDGMPSLCARALAGSAAADDGVSSFEVLRLAEIVSDHYRRHRLDQTAPYDGIPALLDALAARSMRMAILTNKPHEHTVPMVEALFGRWPWVAVEGSGPGRPYKPDPTVVRTILERMDCPTAQIMFVGDSVVDVATGRNAGLVTTAVTWGFRDREELQAVGPDHLIDRPGQLLACL